MIRDLGIIRPGQTLYVPFHTFDSNDPSASVTITGLATTDIEIYKNGSTTQRSSDSGYALLDTDGIDFDAVTGVHGISIDLADNTDSGFYVAGAQYWVVISSITVDAATISFIACTFRIGYPNALINTTIATLASQTSFTLTSGPAEDDAIKGMWVYIHDIASAVQCGYAVISAYTGSTKTVTLAAGTTFTAAAGDNISIMGPMPLQPTTLGRTLDVSSTGEAGIDWANIGSPTTAQTLSGTSTKALEPTTAGRTLDVTATGEAGIDWANVGGQTTAVTLSNTGIASVIGAVGSVTGAVGSVTGNVGGNVTGSVGSVTGNVGGNVVGNVQGNVTGSVGSVAANGITASSIAADAIGASELAADAVAEIADAVWDEARAGHVSAGSFGEGVASVQGAVTGAVASVTGNVGGNVVGSVGSVTGAVGSVTGNVGGNVTGSVGSVAAGGITAASIATDAIDADALAADAVAEIADGVWDEATSGHSTAGTTGKALTDASSAGDPWSTSVPGAYSAGTAGYIVGNNLNATVSSRSSHSAADVWAAATRTLTALDEDSTTLDLDATMRAALGMASANLDTQLDALPTAAEITTAVFGTALTEAYRSTGATGTAAQLLYEILQNLTEFAIASTTKTVKKLDGSTTAKTYTLNDATTPTSITETT